MSTLEVADRIRALMPREARWAYWQDGNGPMFVYNTERILTQWGDAAADGKFESCIYEPYGPGSRSGTATRFRQQKDSSSLHALRKDAKARAYRLYLEWQDSA